MGVRNAVPTQCSAFGSFSSKKGVCESQDAEIVSGNALRLTPWSLPQLSVFSSASHCVKTRQQLCNWNSKVQRFTGYRVSTLLSFDFNGNWKELGSRTQSISSGLGEVSPT